MGQLGEGGMGVVLLAHDERLDRTVALKLVRPDVLPPATARQRFLDEARAMARVHHPNVVEIHAFGEIDGSPYFVMEHVSGCDLESFLRGRGGPLPLGQAQSILEQVCRGLEAIHDSGWAHGDVKSSNVLIGDGFRVALADLGLARHHAGDDRTSERVSGTPAYMAPEIVLAERIGAGALRRADVYSLGVLAYEVLTGRLLFDCDTTAQMLAAHVGREPPPARTYRPDLPAAYERALLDAVAKSPSERTSSVRAFREALEAAWHSARERAGHLRLLVADDDPGFLQLTTRTLRRRSRRRSSSPCRTANRRWRPR